LSKYGDLVRQIIHSIEHEDYLPGEALPSLRQLKLRHCISLNTVRRAYYELERLGYIEAQPRKGYVVASGAASQIDQLSAPLAAAFIHPSLYDTRALTHAFVGAMRNYQQALIEPALAGMPALRRQIARIAAAEGWDIHADQVLVTCGGMEALSLAIAVVTLGVASPQIAVLLPAFPGLLGALAEQGVRRFPLTLNQHGQIENLPALEQALAGGEIQALALMSTYGHPHGRCLSSATRHCVLDLSARYDIPIIEDDAYRLLGFDDTVPLPLKAEDQNGRVLLCGTFSKSLAPGYRVGWLLPGRYAESARRLKLAQTLASPLPNQMALAEMLSANRYRSGLARLRAQLALRVRSLETALVRTLDGVQFTPAEGGYFVWLTQLPVDTEQLAAAAQQHAILIAPGTLCQPDAHGRHCLRLNASYFDPNSQQAALDWLGAALEPVVRASKNGPLRSRYD